VSSSLSSDALKYQGAGYVFGGAPAKGRGNWDCSSFVNWCAGHDLGMAIPGIPAGQYNGSTHGPVVLSWATWSGVETISNPSPGDLTIWPGAGALGHIGIVIGSNMMISALDTSQGTVVTPIEGYGPLGVPNIYRRTTGTAGTTGCASLFGAALIYRIGLYSNAYVRQCKQRRIIASRRSIRRLY